MNRTMVFFGLLALLLVGGCPEEQELRELKNDTKQEMEEGKKTYNAKPLKPEDKSFPESPDSPEDKKVPEDPSQPESKDAVACPMDAKVCPDGSSVGRVPPDCEFALCPQAP